MKLKDHQKDWELLGAEDPLWAVLSDQKKRFGKWDVDEFFQTGSLEIANLESQLSGLKFPEGHDKALDFGCGVGRLTRALGSAYKQAVGVDISKAMVLKAQELNTAFPNCAFHHNPNSHLQMFEDQSFDLIYTNIVLQHIPDKVVVKGYLREFIRLLKNKGIAVFQIPSHSNWKVKINPRRVGFKLLESLGVPRKFLLNTLKLSPIHMGIIPEAEVQQFIASNGGRVVHVIRDNSAGPNCESCTYFVVRQ